MIRPANIVTSCADILAGFGIVAIPALRVDPSLLWPLIGSLCLLLISTTGLYGGGVVLNDVSDAELDRIERPERPIPRGDISKEQATLLGVIFLLVGLLAAFLVSLVSGLIAVGITILVLTYNFYTKDFLWLGPINMALCRSGNLLLGISIIPGMLAHYWILMFLPLIFISGVTLISKGEVSGGNRPLLFTALILYVMTTIFMVALLVIYPFAWQHALPFLIIFTFFAYYGLIKAILKPTPEKIKQAVKIGILSWVVIDAYLAAGGYGSFLYGLCLLLLVVISIKLAQRFSIT